MQAQKGRAVETGVLGRNILPRTSVTTLKEIFQNPNEFITSN
jgi:hypothetical protein